MTLLEENSYVDTIISLIDGRDQMMNGMKHLELQKVTFHKPKEVIKNVRLTQPPQES